MGAEQLGNGAGEISAALFNESPVQRLIPRLFWRTTPHMTPTCNEYIDLTTSAAHQSFMRTAIAVARRGIANAAPNPAVGAVIVRSATNDPAVVVARGWTQPGGRPHAETEALRRAGGAARGGTLYVTLEPCAHHGRTPPCTDAIIAAGIAHVVIACRDPDSRVAGKGIDQLRAAGITVTTDVLEQEARLGLRGHFTWLEKSRPFVQLKMAVSANGLIAQGDGAPVWVTGPEARALGHLLRAEANAIVTGWRTLAADNPDLTCRLPGLADASPMPVILDTCLRAPATARLLQPDRRPAALIVHGDAVAHDLSKRAMLEKGGTRFLAVPAEPRAGSNGSLDLVAVLRALARDFDIRRVLVEGGPAVWRAFLDAGLADEIVLFTGARRIGNGQQPLAGQSLARITADPGWTLADERGIGSDRVAVWRPSVIPSS